MFRSLLQSNHFIQGIFSQYYVYEAGHVIGWQERHIMFWIAA